ncbi:PREDICTED: uncharacterized protein LOC109155140 [Ipomoea nil]|uniref:uncharacterized protein LOC109155140 n=1 Tax=Ipomoea nil TaxID=35883 RepID=UPI000900B8A2|nr:PREDICTED: uncharacterized protein LOC109155140 [Ipomoea nil]
MAAQKQYLHELLREDQQPFHLKSYISDRKSQLTLMRDDRLVHVGRRKSFVETLTWKQILCKRGCLFSFRGSPEVGFPSPASAKTQNERVLLHVPARTAALLLEAAMRIQGPGKLDTRIKNCGLGFFGSVLKRLKEQNNKKKMREIKKIAEQHELGFPCAYNHRRRRRLSNAGWSDESNDDEKSLDLDLEASSSFRSEDFEEIADSSFRFSLHRCPSSGHQTPEFSSPAASPGLHRRQEKENCEDEDLEKAAKQKEKDNKEQCSPVSVLDHSFEDDNFKADEADKDDRNPECNYSTLQKAQQELLYKLHRFEQLAEFDPIELEKLMFEEDVKERVICCRDGEINLYMKVQVSCQRSEENTEINDDLNNRKVVFGKVYNRVDFCRMEFEEWKNYCRHQQAEEIAMEIEVVMFGVLVEELSQELSGS